jgi:RNA 3'-terminal phosphate cyclase (ATP)
LSEPFVRDQNVVLIDGSQGEGGGQILRSSLALSMVTGRPVCVERIRAGREKPGLMRQHLTAIRAATEVCGARTRGDAIGSQSIEFRPGAIRPGRYTFSVGTAGSATLVLQTVLPALLLADSSSELTLEGGTHNPWAPPFEFLAQAFIPLLNRMGAGVATGLERYGFFPAGGGRFSVSIEPARQWQALELHQRGDITRRSATALVANLDRRIAERERDLFAEKLNWPPDCLHVDASTPSSGPGNVFIVELQATHVREVFTAFGRLGASAEQVALEAVQEVREYLASDAPVGPHLADQLLLPLALVAWKHGLTSSFRVTRLTRHATTAISLLRQFLDTTIAIDRGGDATIISVHAKL